MAKKIFTFDTFKTEEEAKVYIKNKRLRNYTLGFSEYWKCYILTHNIYK